MPDNLAAGTFRIVSRTGGEGSHLAGLGGPYPQGMDSQPVVINLDPGNETTWEVTKGVVRLGAEQPEVAFYRLRVGRYGSIGQGLGSTPARYEDGVAFLATQVRATNDAQRDERWIATYQQQPDAYYIGPSPDEDDQVYVWTVPAATADNPNPIITLERLIHQNGFSDTQLFRFEPVPAPAPEEVGE